ncbi:MAG TPA: cellulase family glycosylhydrolase [Opitutaceae bacterium]|nr:cellulase family glycosylhydrolase [Opitutaceae bacterium]
MPTRNQILFGAGALLSLFAPMAATTSHAAESVQHVLGVDGTRFVMDGQPFPYTGISFFNAVFNPTFNQSSAVRRQWLGKFQHYGINVIRIWCQWDGRPQYADAGPESTLFEPDGSLRAKNLQTLKDVIVDANEVGMAVELTFFAHESWEAGIRLAPAAADRAVAELTRELKPYRHVAFQVWNEFSDRVVEHAKNIHALDPERLVTNAPGNAGDLGDQEQDEVLDYLTPHTSRHTGPHWNLAPDEIAYLISRYKKPVVDDEPARNGTPNYGGPKVATNPYDQILQIYSVWQVGGYVNYHHDMFQTSYGSREVPPSGIPEPEFNPYHRTVLEFIALRDRYAPQLSRPAQTSTKAEKGGAR